MAAVMMQGLGPWLCIRYVYPIRDSGSGTRDPGRDPGLESSPTNSRLPTCNSQTPFPEREVALRLKVAKSGSRELGVGNWDLELEVRRCLISEAAEGAESCYRCADHALTNYVGS